MRIFWAVVAGYSIFAISAVLLFHLSGVDPHSPATLGFKALTIAYGVAFAYFGGLVAGRVAGRTDLVCGIALASVIVLGATISIIARPGAGALWTQTAALLISHPPLLPATGPAEKENDAPNEDALSDEFCLPDIPEQRVHKPPRVVASMWPASNLNRDVVNLYALSGDSKAPSLNRHFS
jgi:hypothetical protein